MQGQDVTGVLASAALRTPSGRAEDVIADLDAGLLVRGYPMRGTVFLAHSEDLRWITELCAGPMIRAARRRREQHHDFGDAEIERVLVAIRAEIGDDGISRQRFQELLREAGLDPAEGRGYHILSWLIHTGELAYGHWNGADQQVVLAERALGDGLEARFGGDENAAIAELASRYFRTRGPATVGDFAWWCKLPLAKIRRALPLLSEDVEPLGDETFARAGLADGLADVQKEAARPLLLPGFDEYILGYRDRLFAMDAATHDALVPGNNGVFRKSVVVDGIVRGFWTRAGRPGRRTLEIAETARIPKAAMPGVRRRFAQYPFLGEP